jgi:hypothetical protein
VTEVRPDWAFDQEKRGRDDVSQGFAFGRVLQSRPVKARAALVFSVACLSGCGSGTEAPANELPEGQSLAVQSAAGIATGTVSTEGGHFGQGPNAFHVAFDPASTELTSASAFMPVHGHGTGTPTITRDASGYAVSNVVFSMPGLWNVTFDIGVGTKSDELEFSVDVP